MKMDVFEYYDCWLLYSIGFSKKGSSLREILISGDFYNHAVFTLEKLNYGMSKLIENGYVVKNGERFVATKKARKFHRKNSKFGEGHIEMLFRVAPIFQKEIAKSGCTQIEYFTEDENGNTK